MATLSPYLDHRFMPPAPTDSRGPCPALNALANHGYLPRDGKDISICQMINMLRLVYNLSYPLAILLSLLGVLFCGHGLFSLNLHDLAIHNRLEHDASLAHANAPPESHMAPISPDQGLLANFLRYASAKRGMSVNDLARARVDREDTLSRPLSAFHAEIGHGEAALAWLIMKDESDAIPTGILAQWMGSDRLPDKWKRPVDEVGLMEVRHVATVIARDMKLIRKGVY